MSRADGLSAPRGIPPKAWKRATEFQRRVYRAVCRIPAGQTRSYRWVAERIGRPAAARAVGQALHRNPFAPVVPCHRVIRSDGSLGGFAGGQAKKRRLLEAERRQKICRRKFSDPSLLCEQLVAAGPADRVTR